MSSGYERYRNKAIIITIIIITRISYDCKYNTSKEKYNYHLNI